MSEPLIERSPRHNATIHVYEPSLSTMKPPIPKERVPPKPIPPPSPIRAPKHELSGHSRAGTDSRPILDPNASALRPVNTADITLVPNSQGSTTEEASSQEDSQPAAKFAHKQSQSATSDQRHLRHVTPPSSSEPSNNQYLRKDSNFSKPPASQDASLLFRPRTPESRDVPMQDAWTPGSNKTRIVGHRTATSPTHASIVGQKRTASGQLKQGSSSLPASPEARRTGARGHARHSSVASPGSNIGELSAQLRARLSYAMVKVQNGWQSRTIDEVESLAAKVTSPGSSNSTIYAGSAHKLQDSQPSVDNQSSSHWVKSPSQNGGREASHSRSPSHVSSTPPESRPMPRAVEPTPNNHQFAANNGTSRLTAQLLTPPEPSKTYEAFWRSHHSANPAIASSSKRNLQTPTLGPPSVSSGPSLGPEPALASLQPSLAPPVDIVSRQNPRRSHASFLQPPPKLRTFSARNPELTETSTSSVSTPASNHAGGMSSPRRPKLGHISVRTPSQNAAMEQDAVETLLFMSSPVHSGYHPSTGASTGSPLRAEAEQLRKDSRRVAFASTDQGLDTGSSDEEEASIGYPGPRTPVSAAMVAAARHVTTPRSVRHGKATETQIDQMLDAMNDEASSSDGDITVQRDENAPLQQEK